MMHRNLAARNSVRTFRNRFDRLVGSRAPSITLLRRVDPGFARADKILLP
jgi:hypothetical protein